MRAITGYRPPPSIHQGYTKLGTPMQTKETEEIVLLLTRNTCTQQTLAQPSNISLENPSNIDNFSKLSKRQIVFTIRENAIKEKHNIWPRKLTTQTGNYFIFKLLVVIFTFKISILFY